MFQRFEIVTAILSATFAVFLLGNSLISAMKTTPKNLPIFKVPAAPEIITKESAPLFKEGNDIRSPAEYGFFDTIALELKASEKQGKPFASDSHLDDYQSNSVESSHSHHSDPNTYCPEQANSKHYCSNLVDGDYFDPWNPWCGYIKCTKGTATRKSCQPGTWMGLNTVMNQLNTKDMCRKALPQSANIKQVDLCPELTDYLICKNAESLSLESHKASLESQKGNGTLSIGRVGSGNQTEHTSS